MFLEQFRARDGEVKEPTESMMLPTISLGEVDAALKKNTTYCFKTSPGVAGWCGTCKVGFVTYTAPAWSEKMSVSLQF